MPSYELVGPSPTGDRYNLYSPTSLPKAAGFLWNNRMMIQATCRGYTTAQFMQPEPAKYSHAPNLEAKTFMQPEQSYYVDHPGRFVYIRDLDTNDLFSAPYEPVRQPLDRFVFSVGKSDLRWTCEYNGIRVEMILALPTDDVAELWTVRVTNLSSGSAADNTHNAANGIIHGYPNGNTNGSSHLDIKSSVSRNLTVTPYFVIGCMSWMNQSAEYSHELNGIVASSITPYQKIEDYFKNKALCLKDKTFLICETVPDSWETVLDIFQGDGGLQAPSALMRGQQNLGRHSARYETPAGIVQYNVTLEPNESREFRFLFGPAFDMDEIHSMRKKYLSPRGFEAAAIDYAHYMDIGSGCLQIETPDKDLDNFVNHWLPRQVYYHGGVNRLTTDPQTRNYLQDNMGMAYIRPEVLRNALIRALSQQEATGSMPDGILLIEGAELKYINQVPHTDHCVWLPIALEAYLSETADYSILDIPVPSYTNDSTLTVFERINRAMDWLIKSRDARGLSYIAQGDWCDPMNMVGYKGKGVSGWLTLATVYALNLWVDVCVKLPGNAASAASARFRRASVEIGQQANKHLWDGEWYARGITDDDIIFGTQKDDEGRIWLNPQAWAIMAGTANSDQREKLLHQVDEQLVTPFGVSMFAPPYTKMREDVGRVSQKFPGSAENGAVYNHAAVFYAHSLYMLGGCQADRAYSALRMMIPGPSEEDYVQRGQLPVYIPNYYRGAYHLYPRTAGRSSQLFNTGTVSWVYRCFIEGLCGLCGVPDGLSISPQLPSAWDRIRVTRHFRGATFNLDIQRSQKVQAVSVLLHGQKAYLEKPVITDIKKGKIYNASVFIPN